MKKTVYKEKARLFYPSVILTFLLIILTAVFPAYAGDHFLWRVSDGENTIYLFGSIHALPEGYYPLPDPIENAFEESDTLGVEVDALDLNPILLVSLLEEYAFYPPTESLKDKLPPELFEKAVKQVAQAGIPEALVPIMRPWYIDAVLTSYMLQQLDFDVENGIETYFLERAKNIDMDVIELEGMEEQYRILSGMDEELQIAHLRMTLEATFEELKESIDKLMKDWLSGNISGMEEYAYPKDDIEKYPELEEYIRILLIERNYNMADRIEEIMAEGRKAFIIVGSAHMVGEHGLPNILLNRGYTVEQL